MPYSSFFYKDPFSQIRQHGFLPKETLVALPEYNLLSVSVRRTPSY